MTSHKRIGEARGLTLSIEGIKQAFQLAKSNLAALTPKEKRVGLESLSIKGFVDGDSITVEGLVPIPEADIVSQPVSMLGRNITKRIPFALALAR